MTTVKVESMSRKSLDHILNDVDEPEDTLDAKRPVPDEITDETEDTPDEPEALAAKSDTPADKAAKEEDDKKDGLPPWMHARVKSATEARTAAERRAEEAEQRLAAYEERLKQQQYGDQQQPTVADYLQNLQAQANWQNFETKRTFSKRFAVNEFGAEEVERATAWAYDACAADENLNARFLSSDDPVGDAVREFRKAQTFTELDKYGGDIEKLIEAKLAERAAIQTDDRASPQVQTQRKMPGNFTGNPSARAGRSGPAYAGPRPLSDLLNE